MVSSDRVPSILSGYRFSQPGSSYQFYLQINYVNPIVVINRMDLKFRDHTIGSWNISSPLPVSLDSSIQLPTVIGVWSPIFVIEGYDLYDNIRSVELNFNKFTITTTTVDTIFDARLGCSNWSSDQWKIDPIRDCLRMWGFDPSTLGREVTALSPYGCGLIKSEKEWAKGGDCFIAVLTRRDISINQGEGIPPAWTYTEGGITDNPIFAFIENGVRVDAIYRNLDENHFIKFNPLNPYYDINLSKKKIENFRQECTHYRSKKSMDRIFDLEKTIFAAVGAVTLISFLTE